MNTRFEVKVTAQDVADGVRNSEQLCICSTAIGRLVPEAERIVSNVNTIRFTLKDEATGKIFRLVYPTPPPVKDYIRTFDVGGELQPMSFTLEHPQVAEKAPAPKGRAKTPSFKPQGIAGSRRSVRVFGERAFKAAP